MPDMQGVDGTAVIANNIPKTLDMRGVDGTAVIPRSAPNTPDTRGIDGTAVFGNHTPKSLDETAVIATSKPKMTELWGVDGTAVIADNAPKTPTMRSIDGTAVITTSTPKTSDMRGVDGTAVIAQKSPNTSDMRGVHGTAVIAQKSPNTSDMRGVHGTAVITRGTPMMSDVSAFYNHHSDDDGKYEDDGLYPNRPPSSGSPEPNGPEYWQRHLSALSVVKPEPTSTPKKSEADSSCSVKVESDASASQSPPYDRGYGFGAMDTTPYIQPLPSLVNLALRPASSFHNSLVSATAGSDVKMTPSASDANMTPGGTGFQMTSDSQSSVDRSLSLHDVYYCHLCSFVGSNKSDFNDHMATHFEHQCPNCDYTSRTEGRLRRHIKDFHGDPDDSGSRREQGKPKTMRCRQCNYATQDKYEFWNHQRSHIKDEKMLQCPKCPFVTEYKHHLEYHLRNHFGSKPYKCDRCNYSCVNKSMLNSHMKSHTNVYQYRCADCTYATKYCHSLKLHLKKYNHKPATVLNPDGSLPTDGSGDFELVSKRGPPRGPRGPRKDRSPSPGFSPTVARMPPVQMPLPGLMPGMPHGMWPMMPHGAMFPSGFPNPPPLIPVPGMSPLCLQMPSPMLGGMQVRHHLDSGADDGQALFRRYQDLLYAATQHDNGYAKGAGIDVHESFNGHHQSAPIQKVEPPKSSRSATPQVAAPEESQKKALVADLAACIEAEARESGECPLDLTTPVHRGSLDQSADSPQKRKRAEDCTSGSDNDQCEAATGDHNVPRKRSRKGKAYKLDTLCLKLQEKSANSPPDGYESDDYGTDYEGSSPEAGERQARTPAEGRHQSETDDPRSTYQNLERKVNGTAPLGAVNRDRAGKRDKEEEKDSGNEDHNSTDNSEHVKEASDEQKLSPSDAKCLYKDALSDRQELIQTGRVVEPRFAKSVHSIRENDADLGRFDCCHCGIVFQDYVMYMVHMSYHGYSDPFKCNMCGHEAENRFQFFLHIARVAHN